MSHSDRMAYVADRLFDIVDKKLLRFGATYHSLVELRDMVSRFETEELIDEVDDDNKS